MIPSTKKQRQLIAIGCIRLGIEAETRHEMLMERFGVDSSTKLTRLQAARFLAELAQRGFSIRPSSLVPRPSPAPRVRRVSGNVVRIASKEQMQKIYAVAGLIKWEHANGYERWLKKRMRLDRIRTAADAYVVIEGLKKLFENQMKKEFGHGWRQRAYDDPGINYYIAQGRGGAGGKQS